MISSPYDYEYEISDDEYKLIGQYTLRWSQIENSIANSLRALLGLDREQADYLIFPLNLEPRFQKIQRFNEAHPFHSQQHAIFAELKPLVRAMQFLRGTTVHGVIIGPSTAEDLFINNRSGQRNLTFPQLKECEDLINYTAHIAIEFRITCGGKDDDRGPDYALPNRPQIPSWLPDNCKLPREDTVVRKRPPRSSPG
jgi:hypothetical protein